MEIFSFEGGKVNLVCSILCTSNTGFWGGSGGSSPQKILNFRSHLVQSES